jgi:nucleotide-binding universal stress UspA family protein
MTEIISSSVLASNIIEFNGEHKDAQSTAVVLTPEPLGNIPHAQHLMVLIAGFDNQLVLDRALRAKRPEDTLTIAHGVELWNKLQMINDVSVPGSYYIKKGMEKLVGQEETAKLDISKTNENLKVAAKHVLQALVKKAKDAKHGDNINGVLLTGSHSHKSTQDLALEYAHKHKVDHVFVGDKEKTFRLLGSFCDYIVQHSQCDVTVVKHPSHKQ